MSVLGTLVYKMVGDIGPFTKAMQDAEGQSKKTSSSILSTLGGALSKVGGAALTIGAAGFTAATAAIGGSLLATSNWANELDDLGDVLGTTANESAAITVALAPYGDAAQEITSQTAKLAAGLKDSGGKMSETGKLLTSMGIKFQDSNKQILPTTTLLTNIANKVSEMPDGLNKTQLMMQLFGKSGKGMSDALAALTTGGLDAATQKAQAFGLAIGDEGVQNSLEMNKALTDLKLAGQGLAVTLGKTLLPMIVPLVQKFVEWAVQAMPALRDGIAAAGTALSPFITLISQLFTSLTSGGDPFGTIVNSIYNFLTALGLSGPQAAQIAMTIGNAFSTIQEIIRSVIAAFDMLFSDIQAGESVADTVSKFMANLAQAFGMGEAESYAFGDAVGQVFSTIVSVVTSAVNTVSSIVQTVFAGIQTFLAAHGSEITATLSTAWGTIQAIFGTVIEIVGTLVAMFTSATSNIGNSQVSLADVINIVWQGIRLVIDSTLTIVLGLLRVFLKILKGDWAGAWAEIQSTAETVWANILRFFGSVGDDLKQIGLDVINGIVAGFNAGKDKIINTLREIIEEAIRRIKDMLGIHSPSAVFASMGEQMMAGLAIGLAGGAQLPQLQMSAAMGNVTGAAWAGGAGASPAGAPTNGPQTIVLQNIMDGERISETVYRRLGDSYFEDRSGQWGGVR